MIHGVKTGLFPVVSKTLFSLLDRTLVDVAFKVTVAATHHIHHHDALGFQVGPRLRGNSQ